MGLLWVTPGHSANAATGVDCEQSPHTRLEGAICNETVLRALDRELAAASQRAIDSDLLVHAQALEMRNGIARLCRRETDDNIGACLLGAELEAYLEITTRLGEFIPIGAAFTGYAALQSPSVLDSGSDGSGQKIELLHRLLPVAQSSLVHTGDTDLTVTTIVELLHLHQKPEAGLSARSESSNFVSSLERKIQQGCASTQYKRKWKASLKKHNMGCSQLRKQAPTLSASVFH